MALEVGTLIQMTRDAPYKEYNVCKGDIGVINYVASTNKYSVHIYGKSNPHKDAFGEKRLYGEQGDFWIPFDYVEEYCFKLGKRVKINNPRSKYHNLCGMIVRKYVNSNAFEILLDGFSSPVTFVKQHIFPITIPITIYKEENSMKLSGYNKVAIIEYNGKDYHYALYDNDVDINDKVLVSGKLDGAIHIVKNIITEEYSKEIREKDIISEVKCKVDLSDYEQRVKNREEAIKLRQKMDEEIKKMDELNKYEMYADRNPALKEMLDQLKALGV